MYPLYWLLSKGGACYLEMQKPTYGSGENQMNEFEAECALLQETGLKENPLRREYEAKVTALGALPAKLLAEGKTKEETARTMHRMRRELGRLYKEAAPPLFRKYIYAATAAKYGDPLGPTFEMLQKKKSCEEIIASASRPIADLNDRLTVDGFRRWYEEKKGTNGSGG